MFEDLSLETHTDILSLVKQMSDARIDPEIKQRFIEHLGTLSPDYLTDLLAMLYIADGFFPDAETAYEQARQDHENDPKSVIAKLSDRFEHLTDCWSRAYDKFRRIKNA